MTEEVLNPMIAHLECIGESEMRSVLTRSMRWRCEQID